MNNLISIVFSILSPLFILIFLGYILQKKLQLDIKPLAKMQIYLFIPALLLINIANSQLKGDLILQLVLFTVILFFILMLISLFISKVIRLEKKKEKALINAVTLRNQGNYGIPLISLAFAVNHDYPLSIHMVVLFTSSLLLYTFGLYNTSSGSYGKIEAIKHIFKLPILYSIIAGFILKAGIMTLAQPLETSISLLASAVVPLALVTLGAQLANMTLDFSESSLSIAVCMRLIVSPLIAWALTLLFGFSDIISQVLILGAATPSAVNSVLLALEFNGDADYASQTVFLTTLISVITVSLTIKCLF